VQQAYIDAITRHAEKDDRVLALWLQGSFATGAADRYSDVDAHLLTTDENADAFRSGGEAWLSAVRPAVYCVSMFGGQMLHAVTDEGMRVDLWMHAGETRDVSGAAVRALLDPDGRIVPGEPAARDGDAAASLARHLNEFWRIFAMLPVVVGRDERVKGSVGAGLLADALGEALLFGGNRARDAGVKRLNEFLPDEWRVEIEDALHHAGSSPRAIVETHLRLAALMREHGPHVASARGTRYPTAFEATAIAYVRGELGRLKLSGDADLWAPLVDAR
jgi:hypothetical protein